MSHFSDQQIANADAHTADDDWYDLVDYHMAQSSRPTPVGSAIPDWRPYEMIAAAPMSDADMEKVIEQAATEWEQDHGYTGNSTIGFDADEHVPTLILRCGFCPAEILYYGDAGDDYHTEFTLPAYYVAVCTCGAIFGEGDTLECVMEDASQCTGFGCADGCQDCDQQPGIGCPFCPEWEAIADRAMRDAAGARSERDELLTLCQDALATINRLQRRLADAGLLGTADDLNGFYNGTGVDGANVQVCLRLLAVLEKYGARFGALS